MQKGDCVHLVMPLRGGMLSSGAHISDPVIPAPPLSGCDETMGMDESGSSVITPCHALVPMPPMVLVTRKEDTQEGEEDLGMSDMGLARLYTPGRWEV